MRGTHTKMYNSYSIPNTVSLRIYILFTMVQMLTCIIVVIIIVIIIIVIIIIRYDNNNKADDVYNKILKPDWF